MNLNIVLPSDNNYYQHLAVSMVSLLENNREFEHITIHILDSGIVEENKNVLLGLVESYHRKLVFYDLKQKLADFKDRYNIPNTFSISSYSRLFIQDLIEADVDKIVFADSDSLFLGNLYDLFKMDMEGFLVAGVKDHMSMENKSKTGLSDKDLYINAGFLVIDLKGWRSQNIGKQFIDLIVKHNGDVHFHDQGVLNTVLRSKIKELHPKYNVMTSFYDFQTVEILKKYYNIDTYYSQKEIDEAKKNPTFLHLTQGFSKRPWISGSRHPLKNYYFDYLKKTPIKNFTVVSDNRGFKYKIIEKLFWIVGPSIYKKILS